MAKWEEKGLIFNIEIQNSPEITAIITFQRQRLEKGDLVIFKDCSNTKYEMLDVFGEQLIFGGCVTVAGGCQ